MYTYQPNFCPKTRQKFKEAYDIHFAATIERAEKQIILAKQARRILNLLDDTPIVPGDTHTPFEGTEAARAILNDAEDELRHWELNVEPIHSTAGSLGVGAMPGSTMSPGNGSLIYGNDMPDGSMAEHPAYREKARSRSGSGERRGRIASGESVGSHEGGEVKPPYPLTEAEERRQVEQAGVI
jgi:hypothetical protein